MQYDGGSGSEAPTSTTNVTPVALQAVGADEIDPFTDSVALAQAETFAAVVTDAVTAALGGFKASGDAARQIPGDTPGLYGGTGDKAACDLDRMGGYLGDGQCQQG